MTNPFTLRIIHHDFLFLQQCIRMIILLDMFNRKTGLSIKAQKLIPLDSLHIKRLFPFCVKILTVSGKGALLILQKKFRKRSHSSEPGLPF